MGSPASLGRYLATCCRKSALTKVVNEVSDAVVGLGPIEFLLKDPDVTEVTRAE
jgi:Flp pilus assembly CpaF family ATPase